ncbi:hypothetical protein DAPPUDRAFT_263419 [Daphnia pulex]|uniref:Uncharacterized protein n=1 Tax=Daphnia pulex TaxID=6669 RepID=E9HPQ5_DAPPU|nr:hypothetical protein DAPPUDRAFT_263419 [Daphnia pulex]|eukprot:EFX66275.1 hypothetical protein DAPPUDRAFT_263419 [Daphnia pulex]
MLQSRCCVWMLMVIVLLIWVRHGESWSVSNIDKSAEELYNQFSRLRSENRTDTNDALTMAYHVKQVLDAPPTSSGRLSKVWRAKMEQVRDKWLPARLKVLLWKETVIIENAKSPKYYLFGSPTAVYYTSWIYRYSFPWTLEPVDEARRFRIKDGRTNHYMSAVTDEESYSWRRPIAMRPDPSGSAEEWRIEPYGADGFTIQSVAYEEYLYASKFLGRYKGSLWDVYTWRDKRDGKFTESVWTFR